MLTEHNIIAADGQLLAVETGDSSNEPVVLLHGWPLDHRMFAPQFARFSQQFRTIALDRRGFGRSTAPADMGRELDDIDRLIAQLELGPVHLLGVSQGGRVALRYAARRPENLRSLVLQGAVVDGVAVPESESEHVPIEQYVALAKRGDLEKAVQRWLQHPMMALPASATEARQLLHEIVAGYSGMDLINYDPAHYQFAEAILPRINDSGLAVLLLTGALETEARQRHAQAIADAVENSREVIIAGGGHLCSLSQPAAFNRAVMDFCRTVDRDAA